MIEILEFRKPREERTPKTTKQQPLVQNLQIQTTYGSEPTNPIIIKNKKNMNLTNQIRNQIGK